MDFEIVSEIAEIETIATRKRVRDRIPSKILWWYSLAQVKHSHYALPACLRRHRQWEQTSFVE
jgi:hypothetical protein